MERKLKCLRCGGQMYLSARGMLELKNPSWGVLDDWQDTEIWCCHECGKLELINPHPAPREPEVKKERRCPHCQQMHSKDLDRCPHCGFRMM